MTFGADDQELLLWPKLVKWKIFTFLVSPLTGWHSQNNSVRLVQISPISVDGIYSHVNIYSLGIGLLWDRIGNYNNLDRLASFALCFL